jgi:hypothetical protein
VIFVLFAAESGRTVIDENLANAAMMMQEFSHIYEGTAFGGKTGAGIAEFDCAGYDHAVRFKADSAAEIARVAFDLIKHGQGADLLVELREGFNPDGSMLGSLLRYMVLPKEFIPTSKGYFSIPIDISDLVSGAYYWLIIKKAGDADNHFHLHGETIQDSLYPTYKRAGNSGAWTAENAIHFGVYNGETGNLLHGIYGYNAVTWLIWDGDLISKAYRYLPPASGFSGGVRQIKTYQWSGEILKRGVV